ncbi:acetate--CoA ligase family protein [Pikeienuella piscinae]|uniref:Acetate--CoA ligase family protein n=1 Tax=Pikeienuella piscinae TaxID=2748098 RepID=A0A7L5BU11_9RHOB|nr:acetate--CoA ligase family protein [Pikeienuella piscinae]QIE54661.1 acetate--CoA ligase family protein [Pikeienuella piscinae]
MSDLSRLLRPRSIALIGGAWAANAVRATAGMGFKGEVWPVHPSKGEIAGHRAYPSLAALPHAPDAAFVAVNRDRSVEVIHTLSAMGAGGAVAFASGFKETGDGARQAALVEAAGEMPMLGPNCYGFINYLDGALLWPDQQGGRRVARGVAIVSQSSNIAINLTMQTRGLPIAYLVCAGNQSQTGLAEIGHAIAADPRVTAIGFYVEGVGDPTAFFEMVRAAGKPVVAIKAGRSAAARAATISHTASLAGENEASRAFFARAGVPLLASLPEFLETLKLLHVCGPLSGRDICSVSCSGGEAALVADAMEGRRLRLRPFDASARERIAATLDSIVPVANPLDYQTHIWSDEAKMTACFNAVLDSAFDLTLFVLDFPRSGRCSDADWVPVVAAIKAAAARSARPVAVVASLPENLPEKVADEMIAAGLTPLSGIVEALAAVDAAATCAEARGPARAPRRQSGPRPDAPPPRLLDEAEAKARLAAAGLTVPAGARADTPESAAVLARDLGAPLALKRLGIAHKTEAGAVRLNLAPKEIGEAARVMGAGPYLVERMVSEGAELILGVSRDPAYGLVLTVGAGGVAAELLRDTVTLLLPVDEAEGEAAIRALRLAPLLTGWRGSPAVDITAAARTLAALSRFALAHETVLEELDINPLIVTSAGAWAADALIRIRG